MDNDIEISTISVLEKNGPTNSNNLMRNVRQITGKAPNTIYNAWRGMTKGEHPQLIRDPRDWEKKADVWFCLPGQEDQLKTKKYDERPSPLGKTGKAEKIPYTIRKDHSQKIIEWVIDPWINEIPIIGEAGVYTKYLKHPNTGKLILKENFMMNIPVADELKLFIEDHPYFEHLKKYHVSTTVNPFNLLEELKKKTQSYMKEIFDLEQMISGAIEEIIGLEIGTKDPKIGGWKPGTIDDEIVEHMYTIAFCIGIKGKEFFNLDKDALISRNFPKIEECDLPGTGKYHWSGFECAWVNFGDRIKEQVFEEMNDKMLHLYKELKTKPFLEKERKVAELYKTLKNIAQKMKDTLIEHKVKSILDGTCNELKHQSTLYSDHS